MTQRILLCGTPGTGKSHICNILSSLEEVSKSLKIINISDLVISEKLFLEYDDDLDSAIIDEKKLRKRLREIIKEAEHIKLIIIECHSVGCIPRNLVSEVIVLLASTEVLYDRLIERNYSKKKISENMDCEIMQVILEEAYDRFIDVNVSKFMNNCPDDAENIVAYIKKL